MQSNKKTNFRLSGFTFVELMVALSITAIILVGIVSIVSAAGDATAAARETSTKQGQLRYSIITLKDLIARSRLVCKKTDDYIILWKADNNDPNGRIDVKELVCITRGSGANSLNIVTVSDCSTSVTNTLRNSDHQLATINTWSPSFLINNCDMVYTELIPQCQNVEFTLDASPPDSKIVTVSFELEENGVSTDYEVNSTLRNRPEHLLDNSGEIVGEDDDE